MYFLAYDFCSDSGMLSIIGVIKTVINLLQILVPIALILFGMIDLGKAVMAGKEDEMKKAQSTLFKRCIYAALVFFIILIVKLLMNVLSNSQTGADTSTWLECWNAATIVNE